MAVGSALFRIGGSIGNGLKAVGNGIAGLRWGTVFKGGLFTGTATSFIVLWNNSIRTVADATGMSEGQVSTCIFLIIGVFVMYLIYKVLQWRNVTFPVRRPNNARRGR